MLNEYFDIKNYQSNLLTNYYVAKTYKYTQIEKNNYDPRLEMDNVYSYLYGAEGMMVTGLWSFDRFLFMETMVALEKAFAYIEQMIQYTAGTDIEHALYRFIDKSKIINTSILGLDERKGMSGEEYKI